MKLRGEGGWLVHIMLPLTSEFENYVMGQTSVGWNCAYKKNMEIRKPAFMDFERDSFLPHLKLVPTKYFLSDQNILGKTNNAQNQCANPFQVFVQIMIIRFTLNWMMKSIQVRRNAWRMLSLKQYHAWPNHQANVNLLCKLLINTYAETIKSPGFKWRILCHRLKRETNISLVSSQAWSAAPNPQSMFCICSWASLLSGWNKQLSSAITDQFVRVESPSK